MIALNHNHKTTFIKANPCTIIKFKLLHVNPPTSARVVSYLHGIIIIAVRRVILIKLNSYAKYLGRLVPPRINVDNKKHFPKELITLIKSNSSGKVQRSQQKSNFHYLGLGYTFIMFK